MFSDLMQLISLFFLGVLVLTPAYIRMTKHSMYDEWKSIWRNEIEEEKRKLALQEVDTTQKSLKRKHN